MTSAAPNIAEQALATVELATKEPLWFNKEVLNLKNSKKDIERGLNWELDVWQQELHEAVADVYRKKVGIPTRYNHDGKNKITVRAMHGPGKTFGVADIMHWFNFCFKGKIICTAPKENQLRTRLWPAFRKIRQRAGKSYSSFVKVDTTKITWHNDEDWVALAETASEPENLAGHHADHLLFIVDEASGIREEMYPVIEGAVSTGFLVIILLIGNPTKNVGTFYDSHNTARVAKNYYQIHVDLNKTTRVNKQWVKEMGEKYGTDSPIYKIRCLGEFADADANQLISLEWIGNAKDREFSEDGSFPRLRVAVDVADGGLDETIIQVGHLYESHTRMLKMFRFSFKSSEAPIKTAQAAARIFDSFCGDPANGDDIVIDALGVGAGAAGYLMMGPDAGLDKCYPTIAYKGGERSDNTKKWRNRRVQSYMCLHDAYRDATISYAPDYCSDNDWEDFQAQLCCIRRNNGGEHIEDIESKDKLTRQGVKSPDMADGQAMMYATQQPVMHSGATSIEVVGTSEINNYDAGLS